MISNFENINSISSALKHHSTMTPDKVYLVFNKKEYTFSDVNIRVNKVCSFLEKFNVKKGDVISIIIKKS